MIYHVLPGDAQLDAFQKSKISGHVIVCREALVHGPVHADGLDEFWQQRAAFILGEYGEDQITYHEKVADPLNRLTEVSAEDEVNLWFEYELFCSVNMWFCLYQLESTDAKMYRVEPIGLTEQERWNGFGHFNEDDMRAAFQLRSQFSRDEIKLGADLWRAFVKNDSQTLKTLSSTVSDRFPYLGEIGAAAIERDIQPLEVVKDILAGGEKDFGRVFAEFKKRAGVYGYGDLQVRSLMDHFDSKSSSG